MSGKEDLRVRRTKKALYDAFMQLLCEKPFDEITINELCDVAGVRRATFYKHYSDKFDFLTSYTRLLRDRFDRQIWKAGKPALTVDYYSEYAKSLIYFISENSAAVDNLCKSNLFPSVLAIIVEQNYKDTYERLRISQVSGIKFTSSIETIAATCTGGVTACLYVWLKSDRKDSPEQVAEQVATIINKIVEPVNE